MSARLKNLNLLIASYLEPAYVSQIQRVDPGITVIYEPGLLPEPRYASDHFCKPLVRNTEDERRWCGLLAQADILFDFDYTHMQELPDLAPNVRWIQATSAGIGQTVKRYRYDERMPETIFTTASGVHARPLAEFVILSMLMHYRQLKRVIADQSRKHWERYAGTDLEGRTIGILGLGRIGTEVARVAKLLGMYVAGSDLVERQEAVDEFHPIERWQEMLPKLDVFVLCVPHTPETEKMIGKEAFDQIKAGAFLVNIARGAVVDEPSLVAALRSGKLSGAALDVFTEEPLPVDSPLWEMPQVLVSPHSASTSDRENQRITDLFCDNLSRYLSGEPLKNRLDTQRLF